MLARLKEVLERAADLPAQLADVRRGQADLETRIDEVIACFRRERERQRQFVALLAFAQDGLVALRSGMLSTQQPKLSLDLQVERPLVRVGLVVFCNLESVQVHALYAGNQVLGFSSPDAAPIGWAESVPVGYYLRAHVGLREGR